MNIVLETPKFFTIDSDGTSEHHANSFDSMIGRVVVPKESAPRIATEHGMDRFTWKTSEGLEVSGTVRGLFAAASNEDFAWARPAGAYIFHG